MTQSPVVNLTGPRVTSQLGQYYSMSPATISHYSFCPIINSSWILSRLNSFIELISWKIYTPSSFLNWNSAIPSHFRLNNCIVMRERQSVPAWLHRLVWSWLLSSIIDFVSCSIGFSLNQITTWLLETSKLISYCLVLPIEIHARHEILGNCEGRLENIYLDNFQWLFRNLRITMTTSLKCAGCEWQCCVVCIYISAEQWANGGGRWHQFLILY